MPTEQDRKHAASLGLPHDRATAPVPLEDSSDEAWREFVRLQTASAPVSDHGCDSSAKKRSSNGPVTLHDAMELIRRANRTSPKPARWRDLHALLPLRNGQPAPPPISDRDWDRMSGMRKRLLLRDQVEWAHATGCLLRVYYFLSQLPEDDWDHFD